jgi:murein L,D-transpeptidase YcbB/YkuD
MDVTWTNWQDGRRPGAPYTRLSPNLAAVRDELGRRFGGSSLGGFGVRTVRGGTAWSSHSFGAAFDWRIEDASVRAAAATWLVDYHQALGVQQVHDYVASRLWRANRYPGQATATWWRPQVPAATGMGQAWAKYLHVETSAGRWHDATPVVDRLNPQPPPAIVFDPANGLWGLYPLDPAKATVRRIDTPPSPAQADLTRYLQGVLRRKAAQPVAVDGDFGQSTDGAVRNLQRFFGLQVDGVVGPKTWAVVDMLAAK